MFSKNFEISNFIKIRPVGAELQHEDEWRGRQVEKQADRRVGGRAVGRSGGRSGRHYEASNHFPSLRTRLQTNKTIFSEVVHLR